MLPPALRFAAAGAAAVPTSLASVTSAMAAAAGFEASATGTDGKPSPILDPLAMHRKLMKAQPGAASPGGTAAAAAGLALMAGGGGGVAGGAGMAPSPSLYEMAALTHELDTQVVTTKVKEVLLANNVGQKVK